MGTPRAVIVGLFAMLSACGARTPLEDELRDDGGYSQFSCPERVRAVTCRDDPPACPTGQFPVSDGTCWTGRCLDCVDSCLRDEECVVVRACGCSFHEGCGWVETTFRHALERDRCIVSRGETCTDDCALSTCPDGCGYPVVTPCCDWCDPDGAVCEEGSCYAIVEHMCM